MDENRVEMLARQHGIRQKRDDGGVTKTLGVFLRRADEGTLSRLLVESSILLAATRGNPATILEDAASAYKVDTDAIAAKVKQEFTAKEKSKKTTQPATKAAKKSGLATIHRGTAVRCPSLFYSLKSRRENPCRFLPATLIRLLRPRSPAARQESSVLLLHLPPVSFSRKRSQPKSPARKNSLYPEDCSSPLESVARLSA